MTTPVRRPKRARVHHSRDEVTVAFSREDLQAAGVELDETVDFDLTPTGEITLHSHQRPRRSITEFAGTIPGFSVDVDALRDEWSDREREMRERHSGGNR
ncbi:hypothetical protein [Actinorugispora endophytica]|uniref:Uncharacterized protein n=1 Tax=Actinorugispora endophytica TaxID=1605990 RepID=A0A4R6UZB9_9ACTN|nr:hypothetical protein [Actinorugispora endophytica]TDQ52932.1 hypothetical protein EV190_10549 [Actinorugispora endophytica]